jgi:carboxyl-terminal processing protease
MNILHRGAARRIFRRRTWCLALLVSACGGTGLNNPEATPGTPMPSTALAQQCASNNELAPAASRVGTLQTERAWLRAFMSERYLWYRNVPSVDETLPPFNTSTPSDSLENYFYALLSSADEVAGQVGRATPSDVVTTEQYQRQIDNRQEFGFGARWVSEISGASVRYRIAYVQSDSVADAAGLERGMSLISIDGVLAAEMAQGAVREVLNEPRRGRTYRLELETRAGQRFEVALAPAAIEQETGDAARLFTTSNGLVGYVLVKALSSDTESALVQAIEQLADNGVVELVLDLRYTDAGELATASQLAHMVAGRARTSGRAFQRRIFNDKLITQLPTSETTVDFVQQTSAGDVLPTLNLDRVYLLTANATCAASEALISSFAGVGLPMVRIGSNTCGQLYGLTATDNCGLTYRAVEHIRANHLYVSPPPAGFRPDCVVPDDLNHPLGSREESLLSVALSHSVTNSCVRSPS